MKSIILPALLVLITLFSFSQTDSTATQGEIVTGEVVIEKEKKIILPKADKLFKQAEVRSFISSPLNVSFDVKEPGFEWPPYKSDIPFKKVEDSYPTAAYPNYFKLGYGNFNSPLVELGIFQKFGSFNTSSKVFYERFGTGPVNGSNSGSSTGIIDLSGTYKKENWEITPSINFSNNKYRFYGNTDRINSGFNSERADQVSWNDFSLGADFKGKVGDTKYGIKPLFNTSSQNLVDDTSINKETTLGLQGDLEIKINENFFTRLDLEGLTAKYDGGISYDRSYFNANPSVSYLKDDIRLNAGFNVVTSKSGELSESGFYPDITGEWDFSKDWTVFGTLTGGVEWNGLNELLDQNQFLDDSLIIANTERKLELGGGIKGLLLKNMIFEAGIKITNLNQLPIYVPSTSDSSRYDLTYDDETIDRFQFYTSLTYTPTNISTYGASFELNSYSTGSLQRAWHLPTYVFRAYTSHSINEKLIGSVNVFAMGGMKAPADINFGIANLDAFIDANITIKYLITERASAFVDVNNILGKEYERYLGYPVRGLTFKIGGQYRF